MPIVNKFNFDSIIKIINFMNKINFEDFYEYLIELTKNFIESNIDPSSLIHILNFVPNQDFYELFSLKIYTQISKLLKQISHNKKKRKIVDKINSNNSENKFI